MTKLIVTGGSGFIGTNLIDFYLTKDFEILNLDTRPPQNRAHEELWRRVDICNQQLLQAVFDEFQPDYVLHMAARADLRGKSLDDYDANVKGVENVINVARMTGSVRKVIFASSMLVCKAGYVPNGAFDYCPPNLYGESKVLGEQVVHRLCKNVIFKWSIVRPSSIWGPWFGPTYRQFFELMMRGRYVNFSGRMSLKTYGYIDNVVYQIDSILFSDLSNGRVFYLGDYEPTSIKMWAKEIAAETQKRVFTVPSFSIRILAVVGDLIQKFGIQFPMTTFRYRNMTTDNVVPLEDTRRIAPLTKVSRVDGTRMTIKWMQQFYFSMRK